jgi:hypothetical protein
MKDRRARLVRGARRPSSSLLSVYRYHGLSTRWSDHYDRVSRPLSPVPRIQKSDLPGERRDPDRKAELSAGPGASQPFNWARPSPGRAGEKAGSEAMRLMAFAASMLLWPRPPGPRTATTSGSAIGRSRPAPRRPTPAPPPSRLQTLGGHPDPEGRPRRAGARPDRSRRQARQRRRRRARRGHPAEGRAGRKASATRAIGSAPWLVNGKATTVIAANRTSASSTACSAIWN